MSHKGQKIQLSQIFRYLGLLMMVETHDGFQVAAVASQQNRKKTSSKSTTQLVASPGNYRLVTLLGNYH